MEGNIKRTERRGRRYKQLLDDFKENTWSCKLKEEVVVHTIWRTRFGGGYGPLVRSTTERCWVERRGNLCSKVLIFLRFIYWHCRQFRLYSVNC
jgi:hypothetical protein